MGKVYDALRRAEQQRARRAQEATTSPAAPPLQGPVEPAVVNTVAVPKRVGVARRRAAKAKQAGALSARDLNRRRIALLQPESFVAEQFRTLRARLDSISATRPLRTIAITSALPGDGKTLASVNLGIVTAMQPGRRVLLIDCDLRKPGVASSLGLRVDAGLAEVLVGTARLEEAVTSPDGTTLHVLPVRAIPENPSELLASEAMRKLIEAAASQYDRVILDLPPTLGLPDAKTVSELCDGVVFVVRADVTPAGDVESAVEVLDPARILGVVMNGAPQATSSYERV